MTLIGGSLIQAVLYLRVRCTHRWRPWHPRWHRQPLLTTHTEGNGVGITWTWVG